MCYTKHLLKRLPTMNQPIPQYSPLPGWEAELVSLETSRKNLRKSLNAIRQRIHRIKNSIGNHKQLRLDIDAPPWSE
nr:MAG: hypothetical protein [Microvirus sp.]